LRINGTHYLALARYWLLPVNAYPSFANHGSSSDARSVRGVARNDPSSAYIIISSDVTTKTDMRVNRKLLVLGHSFVRQLQDLWLTTKFNCKGTGSRFVGLAGLRGDLKGQIE